MSAESDPGSGPTLRTLRLVSAGLVVLLGMAAYPLLHFSLVSTDAITEPSPMDDFSCLSCHGGTRGHIQPPDRSCVSCHLQDFRRDLVTSHSGLHPERVGRGTAILAATYALFLITLVAFLWNPLSPLRILLAVLGALLLLAVVSSQLAPARSETMTVGTPGETSAVEAAGPRTRIVVSTPPEAVTWPIEGVFRDGVLAVSPRGRHAIVSVRRRDTNGDGRLDGRDWKTLLLVENGREVRVLAEAVLIHQDRMARWSPDGRLVALVLPSTRPGWTPWDPADVVVFDPEAGKELARWPEGANPFWAWDGFLAWERGTTIAIAHPERPEAVTDVDGLAVARGVAGGRGIGADLVLRATAPDPARRRIVTCWSERFDRSRPRAGTNRPDGILVELDPFGETSARVLPFGGHAPRLLPSGLFAWTFRGDWNGSGTVEIALDGMNLARDGSIVLEDAVFHGVFHGPALDAALVRRPDGFALLQLDPRGAPLGTLVPDLLRHGGTWMAQYDSRAVLAGLAAGDTAPSLMLWRGEGRWQRLASGPISSPQASPDGVAWIEARGESPGVVRSAPWPR